MSAAIHLAFDKNKVYFKLWGFAMSFCIWLKGAGVGEGSVEEAHSWRRRRCDKETRRSRAVKIIIEGEARLVDGSGLMLSQELAYYVTEMPAEQLKRKVILMRLILTEICSLFQSQEPLSPFSRIRSESKTSTLPPTFHSVYLDSSKRFFLRLGKCLWNGFVDLMTNPATIF